MRTPFVPGETGMVNGIKWRVVQGRKPPKVEGGTDLRLDIATPGGEWRAVPMALGFLMADLFFQVEEVLFPQSHGNEGGNRYLRFCHRAVSHGHAKATDELNAERSRKQAA